MSFLNPVNEPVLRFSSTDADAPQINYNARVAGDVKTVLKACLVTGYGAKASAGWSIVNEVDHVAEFVSPNINMIDYQMGIDDSSDANTTWYYMFHDARVNPTNSSCKKTFTYITKNSADNGWELLVTERGLFFIEKLFNPDIGNTIARLTYFGQVKSTSDLNDGENIGFWCVGHGANVMPVNLFSSSSSTYFKLNGKSLLSFVSANINGMLERPTTRADTLVDLASNIYLYKDGIFVAEHPGLLASDAASDIGFYEVKDAVNNSRPVVHVCLGRETSLNNLKASARLVLIYLDHWEY